MLSRTWVSSYLKLISRAYQCYESDVKNAKFKTQYNTSTLYYRFIPLINPKNITKHTFWIALLATIQNMTKIFSLHICLYFSCKFIELFFLSFFLSSLFFRLFPLNYINVKQLFFTSKQLYHIISLNDINTVNQWLHTTLFNAYKRGIEFCKL